VLREPSKELRCVEGLEEGSGCSKGIIYQEDVRDQAVQESFGREVASQRLEQQVMQSEMSCVLLSRAIRTARMLFGRDVFVVRGCVQQESGDG
jgi:hypothetical protein